MPFIILPFILGAQDYQKLIKKADKNFQLGHYAEAIPLYKDALAIKTNSAVLNNLGSCYRLTNQMDEAEETYAMLVETAKRIRPKTYIQYAEVLMNQGNYTLAKEMLTAYIAERPEDENAAILLSNLDKIKKIPAIYSEVELVPFNHNSDADDHGAVFLDDGIVFVSDRERSMALFKEQNKTTGREYLSLYFASRSDQLEYGEPELLPRKINKLNKHTGPASFSKDGQMMVFSQNNAFENRNGVQTLQIYYAYRENGAWRGLKKFPFCVDNLNYMHPAISPDGKTLFFVSDKSRGEGGTDIYVSQLENGKWSKPQNLGPMVNSPSNEGFPFYNEDGKLFFCSKGHLGFGGYDIFCSEKDENGEWKAPVNLGQPINSSRDDISFCLNGSGKYGLFTSSREGDDDDIYLFRFKEDNMILSLELTNKEDGSALNDASIKIVEEGSNSDTSKVDIYSDKTELILDKDKQYDIIILKEGFEEFSKSLSSEELEEGFLKLGAELEKEKDAATEEESKNSPEN